MRLGQMVLVLLGISFITFCLVMLAPGDPVRQMIAGNEDIAVSQLEIDALRHELGLDKPFIFQYLDWLGRVLQGNFGFSFMMRKPVADALLDALPATIILALALFRIHACFFHSARHLHGSEAKYLVRLFGPRTYFCRCFRTEFLDGAYVALGVCSEVQYFPYYRR